MTRRTTLARRVKGAMMRLVPGMLTCGQLEDFLYAYVEGELPRAARMRFDLHIALCRECHDYLARYRETVALSRRAFDDADAPVPGSVPDDLVEAIVRAARTEE